LRATEDALDPNGAPPSIHGGVDGHSATDLASFAHSYIELLAGIQTVAGNSIRIDRIEPRGRLSADSINNKDRVNTYFGGDSLQ
jgi:hypothetical protein